MPIAVGILVGLFTIQAHGTARVGALFGPIMIIYFITIAVLGVMHIVGSPWIILETINPLQRGQFLHRPTAGPPFWRWARWCWR